jgi:hypothetical protein
MVRRSVNDGGIDMTRRVVIRLVAAFCACTASSVWAHHSHPYFYDQCTSVTLEGRVESAEWIDPHSLIVLRLDDGTAHTVDWSGLRGLTNNGLIGPARTALVPGARVVVTGNPIRTSDQIRERFPDFEREVNPRTVDPAVIRRVDDSWGWSRTPADRMPASVPPACAEPAGR